MQSLAQIFGADFGADLGDSLWHMSSVQTSAQLLVTVFGTDDWCALRHRSWGQSLAQVFVAHFGEALWCILWCKSLAQTSEDLGKSLVSTSFCIKINIIIFLTNISVHVFNQCYCLYLQSMLL